MSNADAQGSDIVIVNTCTVTGEAEAKNRKVIRSLVRRANVPVLVTGCAINIDADHYADIDERVRCEVDKERVPLVAREIVEGALVGGAAPKDAETPDQADALTDGVKADIAGAGSGEVPRSETVAARVDGADDSASGGDASGGADGGDAGGGADGGNAGGINGFASTVQLSTIRAGHDSAFRTRVDLKIQDGCNNACSFCIVHTARGPARSMPAREIIEQAQALAESGVNELVLVGIDLAAYHDGTFELSDLIEELEAQTDIARIRISSVEPQSMTPALIRTLANSDGRVCRHLHLCLQSGSSKVLREMNRHYTAQGFEKLVERLKGEVPSIALSTDVIVGFPGETDEDFEESYRLIEQTGFMRLHVFRYSKRPGTPAAARADQVDARVKASRARRLQELGYRLAIEDMQKRIGTKEQVIIERSGLGTSESYHLVACDRGLDLGSLVTLEFTDIDSEHMRLVGKVV